MNSWHIPYAWQRGISIPHCSPGSAPFVVRSFSIPVLGERGWLPCSPGWMAPRWHLAWGVKGLTWVAPLQKGPGLPRPQSGPHLSLTPGSNPRDCSTETVASWEEKLEPGSVEVTTSLQTRNPVLLKDQMFLSTLNKCVSSFHSRKVGGDHLSKQFHNRMYPTQQCVDFVL